VVPEAGVEEVDREEGNKGEIMCDSTHLSLGGASTLLQGGEGERKPLEQNGLREGALR